MNWIIGLLGLNPLESLSNLTGKMTRFYDLYIVPNNQDANPKI